MIKLLDKTMSHGVKPNFVKVSTEVYNDAVELIRELENRLEEAEKAIEFYSNESNWFGGSGEFLEIDCIDMEGMIVENVVCKVGGKRAREYKEKYKVK